MMSYQLSPEPRINLIRCYISIVNIVRLYKTNLVTAEATLFCGNMNSRIFERKSLQREVVEEIEVI